MQAHGYAKLTTTELPGELRFTVVRQVTARRWLYWAVRQALTYIFVSLVLIAICWICGWRSRELFSALYIPAGMYIASLSEPTLYSSVSELRIRAKNLWQFLTRENGSFPEKTLLQSIGFRLLDGVGEGCYLISTRSGEEPSAFCPD